MSYSGGVFTINSAGMPVGSGTAISSAAQNALNTDLATGLSTAMLKDGTQTVTANIPMAAFKFTGLGAGSAATDSASMANVQGGAAQLLGTVAGTNTITATGSPTLTAYASGQTFILVPANSTTGPATLNIDSLGAKSIFSGGGALVAGELRANVPVSVEYDGTQFNVVGGSLRGSTALAATINASATGITFSASLCQYRLGGGECKFSARLTFSSKGASSGVLLITGLPFTANAAVGLSQTISIGAFANISSGITQALSGYVVPGTTTIIIGAGATGNFAQLTDTSLTNTSDFVIAGSYLL